MTNQGNATERIPAEGRNSRRDEIVLEHLNHVKATAALMASNLPVPVDVNDLAQTGVVGLLHALEEYNAANDGAFDKYAGIRIQTAIADSLRQFEQAPAQGVNGMATERDTDWHGGGRGMPDVAAAPEWQPDRICELSDLRRKLDRAMACLPLRFRKVLLLSCDDDLTLEQIGMQIGVCGVRVSQLRKKAMEKMRVELRSAGVAPPERSMMGLARLAMQGARS